MAVTIDGKPLVAEMTALGMIAYNAPEGARLIIDPAAALEGDMDTINLPVHIPIEPGRHEGIPDLIIHLLLKSKDHYPAMAMAMANRVLVLETPMTYEQAVREWQAHMGGGTFTVNGTYEEQVGLKSFGTLVDPNPPDNPASADPLALRVQEQDAELQQRHAELADMRQLVADMKMEMDALVAGQQASQGVAKSENPVPVAEPAAIKRRTRKAAEPVAEPAAIKRRTRKAAEPVATATNPKSRRRTKT